MDSCLYLFVVDVLEWLQHKAKDHETKSDETFDSFDDIMPLVS